jgi:hypothetical protein
MGLLSIRAVDSLPGTGRTTLITIGQRIPHSDLIGTGYAAETITECLRHLGHLPALTRLWEWRKSKKIHGGRKYSDFELLRRLRTLAAELEHTPGMRDVNEAEDFPTHTVYVLRFGSMTKAQRLAGLIPNRTGKPASQLPANMKLSKIVQSR